MLNLTRTTILFGLLVVMLFTRTVSAGAAFVNDDEAAVGKPDDSRSAGEHVNLLAGQPSGDPARKPGSCERIP